MASGSVLLPTAGLQNQYRATCSSEASRPVSTARTGLGGTPGSALTHVGQAEVEVTPHCHADVHGPHRSVPQRVPARCHRILLVLRGCHLQLVEGPDGRPALAQQGLGKKKSKDRAAPSPVAPSQSTDRCCLAPRSAGSPLPLAAGVDAFPPQAATGGTVPLQLLPEG